jgi:hypothetical protein
MNSSVLVRRKASRYRMPGGSSEFRRTGCVSRTATLQRSLPGFAPRTFGEALAHPDDLRCVPPAASRRWDVSRIERCRDRICRQLGQPIQDWPKPFCAIFFCRQEPMSAKHARPRRCLASIEEYVKRSPRFGGGVRTNTDVVGVVHLKPLFPEQVPTSNYPPPFEVGTHLRSDRGDSAQSRGPLCGGVSNVVGCCEKNTGAWVSRLLRRVAGFARCRSGRMPWG